MSRLGSRHSEPPTPGKRASTTLEGMPAPPAMPRKVSSVLSPRTRLRTMLPEPLLHSFRGCRRIWQRATRLGLRLWGLVRYPPHRNPREQDAPRSSGLS
jgi:hypothetical protein